MRIRHWISLLLICALAAGILAGCGGPAQAMGRYAEEALALPAGLGETLYTAMNADGALVYYAYGEDNAVLRYTQPVSGEATGEPVAWLNDLPGENGMVSSLSESPNGTAYAIASDAQGKTSLYYSADGQTAETIDMPDWNTGGGFMVQRGTAAGGRTVSGRTAGGTVTNSSPDNGPEEGPNGGPQTGSAPETNGGPQTNSGPSASGGPQGAMRIDGLMPMGVTALDDGFLVSYMQGGVTQYDAAGKKVREYSVGTGGSMGGGMNLMGGSGGMAVYGNTLALADTGAQEIALYDLATGEKTDTKAFEALDGGTYIGLDKDGLLLADTTGVYRWQNDAFEMVVDGGLTSLVMPTLGIEGVFGDGTGTYYAFLSGEMRMGDAEGQGTQLLRFAFDETIPAEPEATLEVFSLNDSTTVRMAIGAFQRANPNVRVNLEVGLEDSDAATTEDVVRALNTRLISQKGPDVLILDGLPIQSYIEKGVLKDITKLADSLAESQSLMQNLTGAYAEGGKVYGLPALFGLPAMVGDKDALARFTSLRAMVQAVRSEPLRSDKPADEPPVLLYAPNTLYDETTGILMDYYEACVGSFTNADGSLDEAALAAYLSDALALSDAMKVVTPQSTDQRRFSVAMFASRGGQGVRMDPSGIMAIQQGEALSCVQQLTSMGPLMMAFTSLGEDESMALQSLFGQNQFYPRCGVGVVSASKQQMLAEDFIALLLSSEVQDSNLFDGFPVNRASLQKTLDDLKSMTKELRGTEISDMDFIALCEGLTTPLFTDETVKAAVAARVKSLLDGSMTPEQAAKQIVADTKLYLAE